MICALASAAAAQALEATRFEVDFFEPGHTEPVNHATVWVARGMLRIEQQPQGETQAGPTLIYRGDQGLVLSISDRTRSFVEVDRATITRLGEQARRIRHQFSSQLAGLPSGQRAQVERMLGVSGTDPRQHNEPIVVSPGEGTSEVAGLSCRRVVLTRGDRLIGQGCVADWSRIGLSKEDLETFRTLANLQRDAMAARGFTPLELVPNQPFDLLTQLGGMPLSFERKLAGSGRTSAIRVRTVAQERDVAGRFDPPRGYARHTGGAAMLKQLADSPPPAGTTAPAAADGASTNPESESLPASPAAAR